MSDRDTCRILGWRIFPTGFHRGENYSADRAKRIVQSFHDLNDIVQPYGNLGHDLEAQYSDSLGFPAVGEVKNVRQDPDGCVVIDVHDIPVEVGEQWNAGHLKGGSLEFNEVDPPDHRPKRPDVITGFAFLGNEPPGARGKVNHPPAVFGDGTPVPKAKSIARWLDAMAKVMASYASKSYSALHKQTRKRPRPNPALAFSAWAKRFSEESAKMDPTIQKLIDAGFLSAEQAEGAAAAIAAPDQAMAEGAMPATPTEPPAQMFADEMEPDAMFAALSESEEPWHKAMAGCVKKMYADLATTKKELDAMRGEKAAAMSAGFKARAKAVVDRAVLDNRILRRDIGRFTDEGVRVLETKKFAAIAGNADQAFAAWESDVMSRPMVGVQDQLPADVDRKPATVDPTVLRSVRVGGLIDQKFPQIAAKKREAAGLKS